MSNRKERREKALREQQQAQQQQQAQAPTMDPTLQQLLTTLVSHEMRISRMNQWIQSASQRIEELEDYIEENGLKVPGEPNPVPPTDEENESEETPAEATEAPNEES